MLPCIHFPVTARADELLWTHSVPAEHTVDGVHYAMEMEMIYCDGECTLDIDKDGGIKVPEARRRLESRCSTSSDGAPLLPAFLLRLCSRAPVLLCS